MNFKIISDSTCDLPETLLEKYDITLAPLTVVKGDEQFKDGVTITPADIFAHVAAGGDLCSTAAVSIGEYEDLFAEYAGKYDGIVHINIGSGFSACHQNARLAAEDFDNVLVIDSLSLSCGQGLIVLKACELAKTVTSLEEMRTALESYIPKVEGSFLVDKLDYLAKGGRCSSVAALGANLLNLKPCIEIKDNKMTVVKKYRGSLGKCLSTYIKDRLDNRDDLDPENAFIVRSDVPQDIYDLVDTAVHEAGVFRNIYWSHTGCTVACHCGPGTLGVLFFRK